MPLLCFLWCSKTAGQSFSESEKAFRSFCVSCEPKRTNIDGGVLIRVLSRVWTTSGADIAIFACWNNLRGWVAIWRLHGVCDEPTRFWLLFVNRRTVSEVQNHTNLAIFNVLADQDQPAWNTLNNILERFGVCFSLLFLRKLVFAL